jgi:positive regulator of sigma E activity
MLGLSGKTVGNTLRSEATLRILVTIGICVLYGLVLLRFLHFIASTLIFVFGFILVFEWDRKRGIGEQWPKILFAALTSVLTTGAVYGVFQYGFLVNLP